MQPEDTNPYSPPINLEPSAPQPAEGAWRFGSTVLVDPSGQLPNRCVRCGKSSDTVPVVSVISRPAERMQPQQVARLLFIAVFVVVCFLLFATWALPVVAPRFPVSPILILIAFGLLSNLMILTRLSWFGSSGTTVSYCMCRFHNNLRRFYRLSDISMQILSPNMILLSAIVPTEYLLATVIIAVGTMVGLMVILTCLHAFAKQLSISVLPAGNISIVGCDKRFLSHLPECAPEQWGQQFAPSTPQHS